MRTGDGGKENYVSGDYGPLYRVGFVIDSHKSIKQKSYKIFILLGIKIYRNFSG